MAACYWAKQWWKASYSAQFNHQGLSQKVYLHFNHFQIVVSKDGTNYFKLSPWARYVTCAKDSTVFHQQFYNPPQPYTIMSARPKPPESLRIYEAHVGISSQEGKVNTYRNFADEVVPRIRKQG